LVKIEALFGDTTEGCIVGINQAKALGKTKRPLKVIHDAPHEVSLHRRALCDGSGELQEVVPQIADSFIVFNGPLGRNDVERSIPVFGDIDGLGSIVPGNPLDDFIDTRRVNFPTHGTFFSIRGFHQSGLEDRFRALCYHTAEIVVDTQKIKG
jgi:hypothetical protein